MSRENPADNYKGISPGGIYRFNQPSDDAEVPTGVDLTSCSNMSVATNQSQASITSQTMAPSIRGSTLKRSRVSGASSRLSTASSIGRSSIMSVASSRGLQGPITVDHGKELYAAKKFRAAYPIFDKLAQAKEVAAMYHKAVMLLDGLGVPESEREGLMAMKKTYDEAIRAPDCDPEYRHLACYQIGLAYFRGVGARQDTNQAVRWWLRAATEVKYDPGSQITFEHQLNTESGTLCQILLGRHYAAIRPTPDWVKSYNWYREAAQNGSVESMFQVGILTWYGLGCGPTTDLEKTHQTIQTFLGQAAAAGNVCAMANLAMYCLEKQLQDGAFMWATRAIETVKNQVGTSSTAVDEDTTTLGAAVKRVTSLPNNENDTESITKAISMAYFVLAHLHNVGAVAGLDKDKASEFFETASHIDLALVQSLTNLLEKELSIKEVAD